MSSGTFMYSSGCCEKLDPFPKNLQGGPSSSDPFENCFRHTLTCSINLKLKLYNRICCQVQTHVQTVPSNSISKKSSNWITWKELHSDHLCHLMSCNMQLWIVFMIFMPSMSWGSTYDVDTTSFVASCLTVKTTLSKEASWNWSKE